jgi:hypothetical protein
MIASMTGSALLRSASNASATGIRGVIASRVSGGCHLSGMRWRVIRSADSEFLVPDHLPELAVIPVAATVCLCGGDGKDGVADANGMGALNKLLIAQAEAVTLRAS